jgi:SAM-dependent methyltransferase
MAQSDAFDMTARPKPRIALARFLIRLGRFIQSLALMVMRPDDLIEFSRQNYARYRNVTAWCGDDQVDAGLHPNELAIIEKIPLRKGRALLLGLGGGREAIPLARMGLSVTGVDYVPEIVARAKTNALQRGVRIETILADISQLTVSDNHFHLIWLSSAMYSSIPTKSCRVRMLKRLSRALKPEGYFICQFHWQTGSGFTPKVEIFRKLFAWLTLGNLSYEKGDNLWGNVEFAHTFSSEQALMEEFASGGFQLVEMRLDPNAMESCALLTLRPVARNHYWPPRLYDHV